MLTWELSKLKHTYMKTIEQTANELLTVYNTQAKNEIFQKAKSFAYTVNRNEMLLKKVTHPYTVARAMYYLLNENNVLSNQEYKMTIKRTYYCLLKNYVENVKTMTTDPKYADVIGGCELAFSLIHKYSDFLILELFPGMSYAPNYAQKHLANQMFLFGGIVKEANKNGLNICIDTNISTHFYSLFKQVYEHIPTGPNLQTHKENCLPIINSILKDLEKSFTFNDEDFFY